MDCNSKLAMVQSVIGGSDYRGGSAAEREGTAAVDGRFIPAMKHLIAVPALALALAACSSKPSAGAVEPSATPGPVETGTVAEVDEDALAGVEPMVMPVGAPPVLEPAGLGDLQIGKAVPADSGWAEHGVQVSDSCRIVTSPDYPGVYAIVAKGTVRRITVGGTSGVTLADGIGLGASEAAVKAAFPGFRAEPHAYDGDPAKYLTQPGADRHHPGLRFEIGQDGKVRLIHAGTMPELGYVEGCA